MDLRHLRHFVAVAHTLHFGRAAEALGIAQPALSQSIRTLEQALGVRLLERTNRRVELSEAGRALLADAPAILARVERAVERVRQVGEGRAGRLRVAYTRSSSGGVAVQIVDEFRSAYPDVELQVDTLYTARNVEALLAGRLDAAFVRPPLHGTHGLALLTVAHEPFVVVMPTGHRLARRRRLRRSDLHSEPIVTGARERGPGFFDSMFEAVWGTRTPQVVQLEADEEHILRAVARGVGVTVITESRARQLKSPRLAVRRFEAPEPTSPLALAWRANDPSPVLARLVGIAGAASKADRRPVAGQQPAAG